MAEASFCVDARLISRLRPGDALNLARTSCGGLGLSVIRDGHLVVAVGAVTAVPLGAGVVAQIPWGLVVEAEALFRKQDPRFELLECPVQVCVEGETRFLCRREWRFGLYGVLVRRGYLQGDPGTDECVAIFRKGECGDLTASYSAVLLASGGLDMVCWPAS